MLLTQGWMPVMPEQASTLAGETDALYLFLVALTLFFAVAIAVAIVILAVKYRRRGAGDMPHHVEGAMKLELAWTIIPFIISMGIFVWGTSLYFRQYRPPREALEVYVVAKQWMFKFQHPEGPREINELHVPVGRKVKITMTTEDVIHAFFVPVFRIKADIVPGRYTTTWFEATKPGRYHLFCAEYCGTNHSAMIGWVEVMEAPDYERWLAGIPTDGTMAESGQKLFQQLACATCHRADAAGRGPVLDELFGKSVPLDNGQIVPADQAYIREAILNPQAKVVAGFPRPSIMPTFQGLVSEEQLVQLIEYIKSLSKKPAAADAQSKPGATPAASPAPAGATPNSNSTAKPRAAASTNANR